MKLFKRHIKQKIIFKSDVLFGLPIYIDKKQFKEELPKIIFKIPYNIYCVQYRNLFKRTPYLNQNIKFENIQIGNNQIRFKIEDSSIDTFVTAFTS